MYSSISCEKGKKASIGSYDQEQTRTLGKDQKTWANPNIDATIDRAHAIKVVFNDHDGSVKGAILAKIAEAQGNRKVRKDAVTHLKLYATMGDYSRRSESERDEFAALVWSFVAKQFGEKNIVDVRWHFDESAPHLHLTVVPITDDGRLCAKEVFRPTTTNMRKFQKNYYEQVAKPMGYDRPDFGKSGEKGYTKSTQATREQLEAVKSKVATQESRLEHVQGRCAEREAVTQERKTELEEIQAELRASRARERGLETENQSLKAVVAHLKSILIRAVQEIAGFADRIGLCGRSGFAWIEKFGSRTVDHEMADETEVELADLETAARSAASFANAESGKVIRDESWQR